MYKWYQSAEVCYVHLADVVKKDDQPISEQLILANGKAPVWFTRGWTLQELLAPHRVIFYDKNWQRLGSRIELAGAIHTLTKIPETALTGNNPRKFSVTDRLSWARGRETTLDEDIVYCLVGLFGVSIPVLYGEGRKNAMRHLKAEIGANRMDDPSSEHAVTSAYLRDRSPHNLSGSRSSSTAADFFFSLALVGGVLYGAYLVISYGAHLIFRIKNPQDKMSDAALTLLILLMTIIFPPVGVFVVSGCSANLFINICLTILGYIPGFVHAVYVESRFFDHRKKSRLS